MRNGSRHNRLATVLAAPSTGHDYAAAFGTFGARVGQCQDDQPAERAKKKTKSDAALDAPLDRSDESTDHGADEKTNDDFHGNGSLMMC